MMNYLKWAMEYKQQADKLLMTINKEKINLRNATTQDERQSINSRIQILKSMYYEAKLTYSLLKERGEQCIEEVQGLGECVA